MMNLFGEQEIKILPLWQPWASLVVWGEKQYETRSWQPKNNWTGIVAIHATKRFTRAEIDLCVEDVFFNHACHRNGIEKLSQIPLGAIIGSVELFTVVTTNYIKESLSPKEKTFGDYSPGRFAWQLRHPVKLETPISYKGQQNMWDVPVPENIRCAILESRKVLIK